MDRPDSRYYAAVEAVKANPAAALVSIDPLTVMLAKKQLGHPIVQDALYRAYDIYINRRNSRSVMEALLFVMDTKDALITKIAQHMSVNKSVPEHYANYFFDPEVFQDLFDRIDYLEQIGHFIDNWNIKDKVMKQLALTDGFSSVLMNFKGAAYDYTAQEYTRRLLGIAARMVANAQNSGIMSQESDKLFKWMTMASRLSLALKELTAESGADALNDIKLALEFDKPPLSIEELDPSKIVRG